MIWLHDSGFYHCPHIYDKTPDFRGFCLYLLG